MGVGYICTGHSPNPPPPPPKKKTLLFKILNRAINLIFLPHQRCKTQLSGGGGGGGGAYHLEQHNKRIPSYLHAIIVQWKPRYNEVLGTYENYLVISGFSLYQGKKKYIYINSWDQQKFLVIRGFCYIRPLYNEVPLYQWVCDHRI